MKQECWSAQCCGRPIDINKAKCIIMKLGKKIWAIAEGYIPAWSNGPEPDLTSHEAACILNTSDEDAHIEIMIYFSDKDRAGSYKVTVKDKRTKHLRFNNTNNNKNLQ